MLCRSTGNKMCIRGLTHTSSCPIIIVTNGKLIIATAIIEKEIKIRKNPIAALTRIIFSRNLKAALKERNEQLTAF